MKIKHLMMRSKFFMTLIRSNVVLIGAIMGFTWGFLSGLLTLIGSHGGGVQSINNYQLDPINAAIFLPSLIVSSITPNRSVMFIGSPLPPDREIWTKNKNGNYIGQARLILKKDGRNFKNKTIPEGEAFVYSANLSNETDIPVFVTYLDEVWEGAAMGHAVLRYTWLMSQDVKEIKRGDVFGKFKVANVTSEKLIFKNNSDTTFSFSVDRDNGWGRDMRIFTEQPVKLTEGWQAVNLSVTSIMYD